MLQAMDIDWSAQSLDPDQRFHGHVAGTHKSRVVRRWDWRVVDTETKRDVAWGEEYHHYLAMQECERATVGFRLHGWYQRGGEKRS